MHTLRLSTQVVLSAGISGGSALRQGQGVWGGSPGQKTSSPQTTSHWSASSGDYRTHGGAAQSKQYLDQDVYINIYILCISWSIYLYTQIKIKCTDLAVQQFNFKLTINDSFYNMNLSTLLYLSCVLWFIKKSTNVKNCQAFHIMKER